MHCFVCLVSFTVFTFILLANCNIQCLDNDGKAVDWWFAYKSNDGTNYSYFDPSSTQSKLTPSTTQTLSAGNNSCVERTLNQIYNNKHTLNYVGYNDENPNGTTSFKSGHSKGVLAFADTSQTAPFNGGFWLIQAVPKFPDLNRKTYEFASNGIVYGQNFLCISLDNIDAVNTVSNQLRFILPFVNFYHNINTNDDQINNFTAIGSSKWLDGISVVNITSTQGTVFTHLARSGSVQKDIFEDVISVHYGASFEWETWRNEKSAEPSFCTPKYRFNEENIEKVVLGNGWYIYHEDDHAKFGISVDANEKIVCSGDLNRDESQNSRGGGYACFKNEKLWEAINNVVNQVEKCK
eukprot:161_1